MAKGFGPGINICQFFCRFFLFGSIPFASINKPVDSPVRQWEKVIAPALNLKVSNQLITIGFSILPDQWMRRGLCQIAIAQNQIDVVLIQGESSRNGEQHKQAFAHIDDQADKVAIASAEEAA